MTSKPSRTPRHRPMPPPPTTSPPTKVPKFLFSLYTMLQDEDRSVISWSSDGTYFQVHNVTRLEREVLRKYFKHGKLSSFQRQLNNFGFRKWTKTRANVCTFSHDVLVQCHASYLGGLVELYRESRALPPAVASPRTLKRPRDHEYWRACGEGLVSKRASVAREAPRCGCELGSADGATSTSSDVHAAWVFDSIDVTSASALDWDRGVGGPLYGDHLFGDHLFGEDLLLEPLAMEATCEPIDWELAADCLAFADSNLVVSAAFVHTGRACSIQMPC